MTGQATPQDARLKQFLDDLLDELPDPIHKRLIQAYGGENPVQSMESELAKILREVVTSED